MFLKKATIALAQTSPILGDISRNVEQHCETVERALQQGAEAICFPELSLTGYTLRDLNFELALDPATSPLLKPLRDLSKKITIICGGVESDQSGAVFNAAFCFERGGHLATHRKIYPPTYGLFEEMRYFSRGMSLRAFDSEVLGRIGMLVCEDLWHPALPYLLAQDGAQMIFVPTASPTQLATGEAAAASAAPVNYDVNREHHAAYARLLGLYVACVNRVGVEDGVSFWGGSELVSPSGETRKRAKFFEEDLVITEVDPAVVRHARQRSRHSIDEDLPLTRSLFEEIFNRRRGVSGVDFEGEESPKPR